MQTTPFSLSTLLFCLAAQLLLSVEKNPKLHVAAVSRDGVASQRISSRQKGSDFILI